MANTNSADCEAAREHGEMLLALMQHCREMRRQEARSRWTTSVLLVTFFATFLWIHISVNAAKDDHIQEQPAGKAKVYGPPRRWSRPSSVHLLISNRHNGAVLVKQNGSHVIQWQSLHEPHSKYNLTDNGTSLIIPKKGEYLVNLRVFYRIPEGHCTGKQLLHLNIIIMQYHSNYPKWRNVIEGKETMHCETNWYQSVVLNRVVDLEAKTEMKVKTDSENYNIISVDTYFGVTHL